MRVPASVIEQGVRIVNVMPDWSSLVWLRQKYMDAPQRFGADRAGVSVAELSDFTTSGAARTKRILLTFVEQGGRLGNISVGHDHFIELVNKEFPGVLKSAVQQQTGHAQRTNLSISRMPVSYTHLTLPTILRV